VAEFYSSELVDLMRRALDVIPRAVFEILERIIAVQTTELKPLPVKFESPHLKDFAQLDERYELAEMTHRASRFTEGVLELEATVLGTIQVDARQVLHDGLRKELVRLVSEALDTTLRFVDPHTGTAAKTQFGVKRDLDRQLGLLKIQMDGFRRSIEYIQDYVDMFGLKMWQEELGRVVGFNLEMEANRYLKRKVSALRSRHQSRTVPVPLFPRADGERLGTLNGQAMNFMGRVLNCLLALTDPTATVYAAELGPGWFTLEPDKSNQVCGIETFATLKSGINVTGLAGLDRLLGFRVVHELGFVLSLLKETQTGPELQLEELAQRLTPPPGQPPPKAEAYALGTRQLERLMGPLLKALLKVGQAQLLRRQLGRELHLAARLDANLLYQAAHTLDRAVLNDLQAGSSDLGGDGPKDAPAETSQLLQQLNKLLEAAGLSDPLSKIYVVTEPVVGLPVLLLLLVHTYVPRLVWDDAWATLVRAKPNYGLDGMPLAVGVTTLLKQFHPAYTRQLLQLLGQLVRTTAAPALGPKRQAELRSGKAAAASREKAGTRSGGPEKQTGVQLPAQCVSTMRFIEMLCRAGNIPRSAVSEFIPAYLFDAAGSS